MECQGSEVASAGCDDRRFSDALEAFAASVTTERLDIGTINRMMGQRSIAALLLVLALPMALPVPMPGISAAFGVPLIVISAQLLMGRRQAWLPSRFDRYSIARADLVAIVGRALPMLRSLERIVRPRVQWMAGPWMMAPIGAVCLLLAVIITLPVPFGNVVPGAAMSALALGLIERDGLAVALGLAIALLGLAIISVASASLVAALRAWLGL